MAEIVLQAEYWLFTVAILVFLAVVVIRSLKIVRPYEKGVVERFGKYDRTVGAGLNFIIPFMDVMRRVDMRETLIDIPPQEVITIDNVSLHVDAVVYFEVTDPFRVIYNVVFFEDAALKLAQTNLRNVIGSMTLDECLASRDKINVELRAILDDATDKWGVRVTRVEIQKIDPPRDITDAMSRQMKAERTKRAAVLEAEGIRQSDILKAQGSKTSAVLKAEGEAEAIKRVAEAEQYQKIAIAEGESKAILKTFKAVHDGKVNRDILTLKYFESLQKIAEGHATKIFLPLETSGILGAVSSLGEAWKDSVKDVLPKKTNNKTALENAKVVKGKKKD